MFNEPARPPGGARLWEVLERFVEKQLTDALTSSADPVRETELRKNWLTVAAFSWAATREERRHDQVH